MLLCSLGSKQNWSVEKLFYETVACVCLTNGGLFLVITVFSEFQILASYKGNCLYNTIRLTKNSVGCEKKSFQNCRQHNNPQNKLLISISSVSNFVCLTCSLLFVKIDALL